MEQCVCCKPQRDGDGELLERFANLRSNCPALHEIFIPNEDWPDFYQWHQNPDTAARHLSSLLLAMKRGCLARVTPLFTNIYLTPVDQGRK
jgi:hypothetical protein